MQMYGGTQAEMERLLADAQKLSGVKYDINNLNDVYSAIHVIQQELGITGTTAKEATTTLLGSFGAMKAAFSNLLGNMALGENISKNIEQVISTTSTFLFGNLLPMVGNVAMSIPQIIGQAVPMMLSSGLEMATSLSNGLKTGIPQMVGAVMSMISNVASWIVQQAPIVAQAGAEIITNLAQGIISAAPGLITNASKIVTDFIRGVREALPQMIESGGEMINNLIDGIVDAIPSLISSMQTLLTDALSLLGNLDWLATLYETFLTVGLDLITNLINGIITSLPLLVEGATMLITTFLQYLTTNLPMIIQTGMQWVQQLIQGIITALPTLAQGAFTLITCFVQFIGQNLPQILQAGLQLITQLVSGILQAIPQLIGAIPQLISAFVQTFMAFDWLGLGVQAIQFLGSGISSMVGFIGECASTIVQSVIEWISQLPGKLLELGSQAIQSMGDGIASMIDTITEKAQEIYDTVVDKVGEIVDEALSIGSDFVHGLWNGISGAAGWLGEQVRGFCSNVVENVKSFFHIGSPSKLMRDEVGRWLPEGMAVGINANADSVDSAMQRLQNEAMGVFDAGSYAATQKYVFESEDMRLLSVVESIISDLKAQSYTLNRLYELLAELLPGFSNLQLVTDTGALVGEIAEQMDEKLGTFNRRKER